MREALRGMAYMVGMSFAADGRRAFGMFVLGPFGTGAVSLNALFLGWAADAIVAGDRGAAISAILWLTGATAFGMSIMLTTFLTRQRLSEKVDFEIDQRLLQLAADVPTIEHHERPEYLDRLELLRTHRQELGHVIHGLVNNIQILIQLGITSALLISVDWRLGLLPLAAIPSMILHVYTQRYQLRVEDETAEDSRRALHYFDIGAAAAPGKELRVFGLADTWKRRYHDLWKRVEQVRTRARRRSAYLTMMGWSVFAIGYGGGMYLVIADAARGTTSVGQVLMAMTLMGRLNGQVMSVSGVVNWLVASLKTVGRLLWLVDFATERTRNIAEPLVAPDRLDDGITLTGVGFRYPETEVDVLSDVNLHLPAGATVALVGENGAGKTTLIKLLCGFYDPTDGAITVDGRDLARIHLDDWRDRMSAGFQDFARFEVAAGHVVGVGDLSHLDDDEKVTDALTRAGGLDVVAALDSGLDTELGTTFGGKDLSGGQWQKLALGRAMMRDHPLLLVLDEPTANLDAETEHELFERYAEAARKAAAETGAITLLVSHRFSTVRMADLIAVVDGGTVTEVGTHEALMAADGLYAELYNLQASSYR